MPTILPASQLALYFVVIGLGAATGAWLRWGLSVWLGGLHAQWPIGTLAANLLGGWLMGLALAWMQATPDLPPHVRLMLTTGFLGGLTTFSSFSAETFLLFQRGEALWALGLTTLHVVGSLLMTWLGFVMYTARTA